MDIDCKQYIYNSINDMQSNIRVVDTKIALVMAILIMPLTNTGKIYLSFTKLYSELCGNKLYWIIVGLFIITWVMAFVSTIRAIMALDNPVKHIKMEEDCKGTFYSGGMYGLSLIDSFMNRKSIKAVCTLEQHIERLPNSDEKVIRELAFEQLKLAYIRDMKLNRLKWSIIFTMIWLFIGFIGRMLTLCLTDS